MTGQELIAHLLEVDKQAEEIVRAGEKESERLIAEADRTGRQDAEAQLKEGLAALEENYNTTLAQKRSIFNNKLDAYKVELSAQAPNFGAFSKLANEYLEAACR